MDSKQLPAHEMQGASTAARCQQALLRIRSALQRGKGEEAVRFFKDAELHGLIPPDTSLLPWLKKNLGSEATERLILAYAHLPCFYCKQGVGQCESCEGRGYDKGALCAQCLTLGIDRCAFCGGSGWFTINHVPSAFKAQVIVRRIKSAGSEIDSLLERGLPSASASHPAGVRKAAARELLQVNRLLGVLENMASAATKLPPNRETPEAFSKKVVASCRRTARKLRTRVLALLGILSKAAKLEGESATGARQRLALARAEFFKSLGARDNFRGTLLRHPLLFDAQSSSR